MVEILLALILALTGIGRAVDPELTMIAERRVVEIQSNWSHEGRNHNYYEVLAYNDVGVEHAVDQWRDSPDHAAIIFNPDLTQIGCAVAVDNSGLMWYACILNTAPPVVKAPAILLPNTAMSP